MARKTSKRLFLNNIGPILFRITWWAHLDPSRRDGFADDLIDAMMVALIRVFECEKSTRVPNEEYSKLKKRGSEFIGELIQEYFSANLDELLPEFDDDSFENVIKAISARNTKFNRTLYKQYRQFLKRKRNLSPELLNSVKTVNEEYLIWLKTHPNSLPDVSWEAFEKLTAEILCSQGFSVALTARSRGKNADIMAIQHDHNGRETKYLVECKRYKEKIGIGIVNSVIGAKVFQGVEHAMLVTTSSFTRDVKKAQPRLEELKLELKDGNDVIAWLQDYEFRADMGLWLEPEWHS